MSSSHLYSGFTFASALRSVRAQRELQSALLVDLSKEASQRQDSRFLSAGVGWGDELSVFAEQGALAHWAWITAMDIAEEVEATVLSQPFAAALGSKLRFVKASLESLPSPFGESVWDCIQCGFVIEDVEYEQKQDVYTRLFRSLRSGGALVVSEMFLDNRSASGSAEDERIEIVGRLYDRFITEAEVAISEGQLTSEQFDMLCGDGRQAGLLASKAMAQDGNRDFFETRLQTENHLRDAGFQGIQFFQNPVNPLLGVITAQRPSCQQGADDVLGKT